MAAMDRVELRVDDQVIIPISTAMKRVFGQIVADGTSHNAETWIAGVDEAIALQSPTSDGDTP